MMTPWKRTADETMDSRSSLRDIGYADGVTWFGYADREA